MHIKKIYHRFLYIISLLINSSLFLSCHQQNSNQTFVVPLDTMPVSQSIAVNTPPLPTPQRAYYFPSNFIIDSAGQVFFYQISFQWKTDGDNKDWNTPPNFINLKTKDIIQIPFEGIEAFFKLNILNKDSLRRYVSIASSKDTTSSSGLSKIIGLCNEKNNHVRWKFRMVTQEESVVLDHKKRQVEYYPDRIKWDSAKVIIPIEFKK